MSDDTTYTLQLDTSSANISAESLFQVFTQSNIVIILWFLAVYFIVYLLLNIIRGKDGVKGNLSRWIDIVSLLCVLIYLSTTYFARSDSEKQKAISDLYSNFKSYLNTPLSIISVGFFIFMLYTVIYILVLPMDPIGKPITITVIENGAWILFVLILFANFLRYITGISITAFMDDVGGYFQDRADASYKKSVDAKNSANTVSGSVSINGSTRNSANTYSTNTNTNTNTNTYSNNAVVNQILNVLKNNNINVSDPVTGSLKGNANSAGDIKVTTDEVFNIGNNMYTYDDAQTVCQSFGARLATYDEIESAYNNGGEWCNYGWSDGQAAYFPTQKQTWQKLQKSDKTKNSCGRPGVNGGFIDNPDLRFGVNCFGKKPKPKDSDLKAISAGLNIPKSQEDILLEKKIQFWKDNGDKLFKINGYNNNKWSMY